MSCKVGVPSPGPKTALEHIFLSYTPNHTAVLEPTTSCLVDGCHLPITTLPLLLCTLNLDEYWVGSQVLQLKRSPETGREMCSGTAVRTRQVQASVPSVFDTLSSSFSLASAGVTEATTRHCTKPVFLSDGGMAKKPTF